MKKYTITCSDRRSGCLESPGDEWHMCGSVFAEGYFYWFWESIAEPESQAVCLKRLTDNRFVCLLNANHDGECKGSRE